MSTVDAYMLVSSDFKTAGYFRERENVKTYTIGTTVTVDVAAETALYNTDAAAEAAAITERSMTYVRHPGIYVRAYDPAMLLAYRPRIVGEVVLCSGCVDHVCGVVGDVENLLAFEQRSALKLMRQGKGTRAIATELGIGREVVRSLTGERSKTPANKAI